MALFNESDTDYVIHDGDRIAQIVITPYLTAQFEEAEDLDGTERGCGGFGSTGIQ